MRRDEIHGIVGDELMIVEHDGAIYATNRCWFAPAERTVSDLLEYWNLPVEDGLRAERSGKRWSRTAMPKLDIARVTNLRPTTAAGVATEEHTKLPLLVEDMCGHALAMFDTPGGRCYVRLDYLRLCAGPLWHQLAWKCDEPTGPLRHDGDGGMVLIMPVRMP
jgi:hypothetical protein